jgi:curved DNA-binding protein CbpA
MHEAGAAVVAAQLLAFYKEPVRYRSRLTHGRETFEGGLLVFRFAHGKFSHALMRDLSPAERERLRTAAAFFIRQVCLWEGATHYQLLCVAPGARREAIKDHYHGLIALLHPDRQEAAAEQWPSGAAQRVNQAYTVLCHDALRSQYDAGLHTAQSSGADKTVMEAPRTAAARAPVVGRFAVARIRMRKPVLLLGAGVASLFFAQVWWFGDLPREYATLAGAAPFDLSSRWMRDVHSNAERPRFIEGAETRGAARASAPEAPAEAPIPFLTPLWRALATRAGETRVVPPDTAEAGTVAPLLAPDRSERPARPAEAPPARVEAPPRAGPPAVRIEAPVARSEPPAARTPPLAVAQSAAPPAPRPAERELSATDMEMLVVRLVTYYEGGELDRLLAMYDVGSIGFWEAIRIRHDFQEFFRSTRARRLRLNRVSWETAAQSARARGEAALTAEYADQGGKLERTVELELDVVVRDGQLRIARLSLFPHQ